MKDEWISPFQEKLGDYELDIPVPAARGRKLLFPVIAAVAAAAALALLLWLPVGQKADPARTLQPLIAAAQPQPDVLAQLPGGQLLANPPARRFAASTAPTAPVTIKIRETTQPSETTDRPETPETPTTPDAPTTPDTPVKPVAGTPDTNQPLFPDFPETDDLPRRKTAHRLSVQAYASPFNPQKSSFIVPVTPSQVRSESDQALNEWVSNSIDGRMNYSFGMAKMSIPETAFPNVNTHSRLPLKTGLSVRYTFGPRFQLESGLTYTYHFIEQGVPNGETEIPFSEYRLHYVGLPIKTIVPIIGCRRLHVYAGAGGEAELLAGGTRTLFVPSEEKVTIDGHPFQLSLLASAGIELMLIDRLSLYAEPGAAWHIVTPESLPGYYREHPVSFDFRFGLRFDL